MSSAIFLVLAAVYFWPALSSNSIFSERDLGVFFAPPRYLWIDMVRSLELPLWNPHNYSGIPLLATLQTAILYPPNVLFLFLPFPFVWNYLIVLHFAFAGSSTYYFLRYIRASALASLTGGTIFMLSGYLLSVHNLLPHLLAVGWFPLVLLYFMKHCETGRFKDLALSVVFLCIEFLAGAPEVVILTCFTLFVLTLYLPAPPFGNRSSVLNRLKPFLILLMLFLLLSAIQLIPFYELKLNSIRSEGLSYQEATTWSLAWKDFLLFFLPDAFGYAQTTAKYWSNQSWLKTIYLGSIPFVMSLFFFLVKDRKRTIFLIFMAVSLFLALGGSNPLYRYLHHIPPFNAIRYPVKFLFLFFFSLSVTAGLGFDRLAEGFKENGKRIKHIVIPFFYISFVFAILWGCLGFFDVNVRSYMDAHNLKPNNYNEIWFNLHNLKRFLFFSFLFGIALLVYIRTKIRYRRYVLCGIVMLLIADLFLANYGYYQTAPWKSFISQPEFTTVLSRNSDTARYFVTEKTNAELGKHFPTDRDIMNAPYASLFGLYAIQGSEIMQVQHHNQFMNTLLKSRTLGDAKRFIDVAGIRFIITSYEIDDPDFKCRDRINVDKGTAYLYEYVKYPGRFLLYTNVVVAKGDKETMEKLIDKSYDLRKTLMISDAENANIIRKGAGNGNVHAISQKANSMVLQTDADRDAFLYVSDTYYPGWRAYVDGKRTNIYRANLAFRAVQVPRGKHTVVFKYVPMSFYIGLLLTCIGITLCVFLWRKSDTDG